MDTYIDEELLRLKSTTIERFVPLWRHNFAENTKIIERSKGVNQLVNKLKNIPGIIIGAGPSLDKNIKYLPYISKKTVIISTDAALRVLIRNGIMPSIVVNLDPQEYIIEFFLGLNTRGMYLIAPSIIHPEVLKVWMGEVIFYNKYAHDIPVLDVISKQYKRLGNLTPGGSVSSIAFDLAVKMGNNPIIFVGQDLSFASESQGSDLYPFTTKNIYARGFSSKYVQKQLDREELVCERDIFNGECRAFKSMVYTRTWLRWAIETWESLHNVKIINSTEGGILSKFIDILPLYQSSYLYCTRDININWILKKVLSC